MKKDANLSNLIELITKYPNLPIVPMVNAEIVADDSGYWMGAWGNARVDEFYISKRGERVFLKSDNDIFDVLERDMSIEEFNSLPDDEETCRREYYDKLPWQKAIIVYITT